MTGSLPRHPAANETIAVLGASGAIGSEIVAALVARGRHVTAIARNAERLSALARRIGNPAQLAVLPGSVAGDVEAAELVRALRTQGRGLGAVVAALRGPLESGRLLDRSAADLRRTLDADLLPHFIAARHFIPLLAESGAESLYLMLSGPMGACAWAGYGHLSVTTAALQMLIEVLREEAKDLAVTLQQLQIRRPVRSAANADCACPEWVDAQEVAARACALIGQRDRSTPIVEIGTYSNSHFSGSAPRGPLPHRSLS